METILVLYKKQITNINFNTLNLKLPKAYYKDKNVLKFIVNHDFNLSKSEINFLNDKKIDWAIIPRKSFNDIKLVASDMDSTFIDIECIDEIAKFVGLQDKVSLITEKSMKGDIDFTKSLIQRCLLLKGVAVDSLQYIYDNILKLSKGVELFLHECKKYNIKFMLISGGFDFFTNNLKFKYNLDYSFANKLEIKNGFLTGNILGNIIDARYKSYILEDYANKLNIQKDQIIAIGDGANDIIMLQSAGFKVAYHAKQQVKQCANIHIDFSDFGAIRYFFD